MYMVESIKTPIKPIFANSEREAVEKYAKKEGFKDSRELIEMCERECGSIFTSDIHVIDVQRITKPN